MSKEPEIHNSLMVKNKPLKNARSHKRKKTRNPSKSLMIKSFTKFKKDRKSKILKAKSKFNKNKGKLEIFI